MIPNGNMHVPPACPIAALKSADVSSSHFAESLFCDHPEVMHPKTQTRTARHFRSMRPPSERRARDLGAQQVNLHKFHGCCRERMKFIASSHLLPVSLEQ